MKINKLYTLLRYYVEINEVVVLWVWHVAENWRTSSDLNSTIPFAFKIRISDISVV